MEKWRQFRQLPWYSCSSVLPGSCWRAASGPSASEKSGKGVPLFLKEDLFPLLAGHGDKLRVHGPVRIGKDLGCADVGLGRFRRYVFTRRSVFQFLSQKLLPLLGKVPVEEQFGCVRVGRVLYHRETYLHRAYALLGLDELDRPAALESFLKGSVRPVA